MKTDHFALEGSPLKGHPVPADWTLLDLAGKRAALVRSGIAYDYHQAASMLGKHAAAVRKLRSSKKSHGR